METLSYTHKDFFVRKIVWWKLVPWKKVILLKSFLQII